MSLDTPQSEEYKPMGQRKLAAIMFTDVAGFSRLMGENEERTMGAVERDLRRITSLCEESSGRVLKVMGDGILALFYSAVRAVECAREIQRQLAEQAQAMPPEDVLEHRIGIHLGDVYVHENEVMGEGVNIAARLQAEAPPGGICISQALYEVVKRRLAIQTVHRGAKRLKNIKEEVHVYQIVLGDDDHVRRTEGRASAHPWRRHRVFSWAAGVLLLLIIATIAYIGLPTSRSSRQKEDRDREGAALPTPKDTSQIIASQPTRGLTESPAGVLEGNEAVAHVKVETVYVEPEQQAGPTESSPAPSRGVEMSAGQNDRLDSGASKEPHLPVPEPRSLFDRFDRNHDGNLSWGELPPRVRPEIMRADVDHDGAVSWQELTAARPRFGPPPIRPDSLPRRSKSNGS